LRHPPHTRLRPAPSLCAPYPATRPERRREARGRGGGTERKPLGNSRPLGKGVQEIWSKSESGGLTGLFKLLSGLLGFALIAQSRQSRAETGQGPRHIGRLE